jgi:HAMP domain-containing protein
MVASVSEYGIYTENVPALDEIARSLGKDKDIAYITIFNKERQALLSRDFKPDVSRNESGIPDRHWDAGQVQTMDLLKLQESQPYIDVVVPVVSMSGVGDEVSADMMFEQAGGSEVVGFVQLGLDQTVIHDDLKAFLHSMIIVATVITVVGILITILLTRRITAPVASLVQATHNVAQGDFDYRVTATSRDEIGDLARHG